MHRNTITVMSGQVVDFFDNDFREMYAVSEQVDLYKEFNITKPPMPAPVRKPVARVQPPSVSTSRFQVSLGDSRQADMKVPAHKYHNPKYSLVVGNNLDRTCSLQDLSRPTDLPVGGLSTRNGLLMKSPQSEEDSREPLDRVSSQSHRSPVEEQSRESSNKPPALGEKKHRSSFRQFLKGRGPNESTEAIAASVVTPQSPSPNDKMSETNCVAQHELEDSFEIIDRPNIPLKNKKHYKLPQRSVSLQTINTGNEDGHKGRKIRSKKNCVQS